MNAGAARHTHRGPIVAALIALAAAGSAAAGTAVARGAGPILAAVAALLSICVAAAPAAARIPWVPRLFVLVAGALAAVVAGAAVARGPGALVAAVAGGLMVAVPVAPRALRTASDWFEPRLWRRDRLLPAAAVVAAVVSGAAAGMGAVAVAGIPPLILVLVVRPWPPGAGAAVRAPAFGVAGVAVAVATGLALGAARWELAAVLIVPAGWLLALPLGGRAGASVLILTLAMPFYGAGWVASLASGLGLFTVMLLAGGATMVAGRLREAASVLRSDRRIWLVGAWGAVLALSLLIAERTPDSVQLGKTYAGRSVLFPLVVYLGFLLVGRATAFPLLRWCMRGLLALAVAGSVLGLAQVGLETAYPTPSGQDAAAIEQFVGSRAVGLSESPGTWAAFLVIVLPAAVAAALRRPRGMVLAAVPLLTLGVALTGLRSAWAAALVAIAVVAFLSGRGRRGLLVVGLVLLAVVSATQVGGFRDFIAGGGGGGPSIGSGRLGVDESARGRWLLMREELEIGLRRPVTGVGLGNIGRGLTIEDREEGDLLGVVPGVTIEKHNVYTGLFAELGLPGLTLFLALLAAGVGALWRVRRAAGGAERALVDGLLGSLVATALLANATEADRQVFLWWLLGAAFALAALTPSATAASSETSRRRSAWRLKRSAAS